jgi:hypothetical protein
MPTVRGCAFPDHLRYDVPNHLWYEPLGDGTARIGMTVVAVALAGEVLAFTPKRVGRRFDAGRSGATIESGDGSGRHGPRSPAPWSRSTMPSFSGRRSPIAILTVRAGCARGPVDLA